jgi:hypothetical protein
MLERTPLRTQICQCVLDGVLKNQKVRTELDALIGKPGWFRLLNPIYSLADVRALQLLSGA